jgi:hypothetical protein
MNVFDDRVIFRLTKLLKHSRPGVHQKPIDLKSYPDQALCVVKCLEVYIPRTAHLRDCDSDTLLISFMKPYHRVSTDTIARWIKTVMRLAGIDTSIFKAHSTRSASTSAATKLGVPLQDIMSSAGWGMLYYHHFQQNKVRYFHIISLMLLNMSSKFAVV